MARSRNYVQCDVFSRDAARGNALAVVLDADGLSDEDMATFARWTNLAETTFVFPPSSADADYRVRIFTPNREMPFAGHPTLGTCMAWLHNGGQPASPVVVRQECVVGVVDVQVAGDMPAFVAPPTRILDMADAVRDDHLAALGIDESALVHAVELDNGPRWRVFELSDAAQVLAVNSSRVAWPRYQAIGLIGKHAPDHECDYEVRMLAPSSGLPEDPITGSLNAALGHWLQQLGRLGATTTVAQGTSIGRSGRVTMTVDADRRLLVGGHVALLITGTVTM